MAPRISFVALLVFCCGFVAAFVPRALPSVHRNAVTRSSKAVSRPRAMSVSMSAKEYWEGEWVCADCGYIYNKDDCGGLPFEEQKFGFKCPQCSAPRRRFAKKVGDKVAVTLDGGDAPIVLFSVIGGLAVIGFGIYAALNF